jgi:DNA-directed RNA polymerase subunit M/transcription elongation factor TFIIS|tara:strand:- start:560 stop:952 length:393 start_codon:yes stop_codon:yes gene_type:complete
MGQTISVTCKKCGHKFKVAEGGGFVFHLLHCDSCSKTKSISFDEIGEPHLQYLKGLKGPYCTVTSERDKHVQDNYKGKALSEKKYYAAVEKIVGDCKCGGTFKFNAKPRCPKCKSLKFTEDENGEVIHYD